METSQPCYTTHVLRLENGSFIFLLECLCICVMQELCVCYRCMYVYIHSRSVLYVANVCIYLCVLSVVYVNMLYVYVWWVTWVLCVYVHVLCVHELCVYIYMCCMCVCCVCMYVYICVYLCLSVKILLFLFAVSIVSTFWGGTRRVSVLTKAHFINVFLHINKAAFRMMSFLPRCFVFVLLPGWCRFCERHLFHQGKTNSRVCCMLPCVLSTVFARLLPSGYWVLLTVWGRERGRWCLLSLFWILSLAPPTQSNLPLHCRPSLSLTELGR